MISPSYSFSIPSTSALQFTTMTPIIRIDTRVEIAQTQTESPTRRRNQESGGISPQSASYWSETSTSCFESGDQAAALRARQQAVEIYRHLYAEDARRFENNLARELLELSKNLAGNGQIDEAFEASQESGKLYEHLLGVHNRSDCAQSSDCPLKSIERSGQTPFAANLATHLLQIIKKAGFSR
ncbi:unnamed protein product [Rhizoctonia solani]|uniref:Uncharacterized protein n=1 Tax=Rhizoctonia solani TaxID=456999 RepID=A0A8H3CBX8_9AGAM|nr:unnamed protein product [Rhizoctonia solani]